MRLSPTAGHSSHPHLRFCHWTLRASSIASSARHLHIPERTRPLWKDGVARGGHVLEREVDQGQGDAGNIHVGCPRPGVQVLEGATWQLPPKVGPYIRVPPVGAPANVGTLQLGTSKRMSTSQSPSESPASREAQSSTSSSGLNHPLPSQSPSPYRRRTARHSTTGGLA